MQLTNKQASASESNANITIISGGYGMGKTTALLGKAFASKQDCIIVSYGMDYAGGAVDEAKESFKDHITDYSAMTRTFTTTSGNKIMMKKTVDMNSIGGFKKDTLVLVDNANTSVENDMFLQLTVFKNVTYATNVTEDSKSFLRKAMLFSEYNGLDEFCVVWDGSGIDAQPVFVLDKGEGYKTIKVVKLEKNQFLPDSYYENLKALPPEYKKRVSGEWL